MTTNKNNKWCVIQVALLHSATPTVEQNTNAPLGARQIPRVHALDPVGRVGAVDPNLAAKNDHIPLALLEVIIGGEC